MATVPQDIKQSFTAAVENNKDIDGEIIWTDVDADMCLDLMSKYDTNTIFEAMNYLADTAGY